MFGEIAQQYHVEYRGHSVRSPETTLTTSDRRRAKHCETCDWVCCDEHGSRRVKAKHAQITWDRSNNQWCLRFRHVKLDQIDELVLIVYAPWGLELWSYCLEQQVGLHTCGLHTQVIGHGISFLGSRKDTRELSRDSFLKSNVCSGLQRPAEHIVTLTWDHGLIGHQVAKSAEVVSIYTGVLLESMSRSLRGRSMERIAMSYDSCDLSYTVQLPSGGNTSRGQKRGSNQQTYDWVRFVGKSLVRVEAKSASFVWDESRERWTLSFYCIKRELFDCLLLVLYSPWGVDIWEYNLELALGWTTTGKLTNLTGCKIVFVGPVKEKDGYKAWTSKLRPRLEAAASHAVTLPWSHPIVAKCLNEELCRTGC